MGKYHRIMRIVQFVRRSNPRAIMLGAELGEGGGIVDLSHIAPNTLAFVKGGKVAQEEALQYLGRNPPVLQRNEIDLAAPITGMDKVLCIGMNYRDHCEEQGAPIPTEPLVFNKFPSCVTGPRDDIPFPGCTEKLDWEVELVVVVGKETRPGIGKEEAMDCVYGYTASNDLSARDWQLKRNGGQWLAGKAMDKFAPIGPAIVTRDEILDPQDLSLSCSVNGVTRQDSNTCQMVFGVGEVVAWVSQFATLLPGDIILTGTPPGVGAFLKPEPVFLKRGDVVTCRVDKIGAVVNKIV